jgi:hypothetical protein
VEELPVELLEEAEVPELARIDVLGHAESLSVRGAAQCI